MCRKIIKTNQRAFTAPFAGKKKHGFNLFLYTSFTALMGQRWRIEFNARVHLPPVTACFKRVDVCFHAISIERRMRFDRVGYTSNLRVENPSITRRPTILPQFFPRRPNVFEGNSYRFKYESNKSLYYNIRIYVLKPFWMELISWPINHI